MTLFWACGGTNGAGGGSGGAMLTGSIQPTGEEESGEVEVVNAFGFELDGRMLAYLSSNPASTCDNVAEYLSQKSSDSPYDPIEILSPGKCNMTVPVDNWDDGLSTSEQDENYQWSSAGTVINCAMGEGDFNLETRDEDDTDYYWTGRWWQGSPTVYEWSFSGGDGDDLVLDIVMSSYDGDFIYEGLDESPAEGEVSGTVNAQWCPGLVQANAW